MLSIIMSFATQKLASVLFRAFDYVNPEVVEDILGVGPPVNIESQATEGSYLWNNIENILVIAKVENI